MNRLFKVVFSKARGQYVVCGEYSKTHTKSSSLKAVVASAIMGLSMITGVNVLAATEYSIYDATKSTATSNVTLAKEDSGDTPNYAYTTGDTSKTKLTLTQIGTSTTATEFTTSDHIYFYYNNNVSTVENALQVATSSGMEFGSLFGAYVDGRGYATSGEINVQSILKGGVQVTTDTLTASNVVGVKADADKHTDDEDNPSYSYIANTQVTSNENVNVTVNGGDIDNAIIGLDSYSNNGAEATITNNKDTNVTVTDVEVSNNVVGVYSYAGDNAKSTIYNQNVNLKVLKSESGSGASIDNDVNGIGAAIGYVDPNKAGSAYFKASVLNDWEGEMTTKIKKGSVLRRYKEDMGGTWGEFALGGTYNLSKDWSVYGEAETTAGNPVRTTYQFSAGVRYSF